MQDAGFMIQVKKKRNAKASRRRCEERKKKRAETDTKKNTDRHGRTRIWKEEKERIREFS